jgi:hypothetical protein
MDRETCNYIVMNTEGVEAAILLSEGRPVAWHSRRTIQIDAVAAVAAGLVSVALSLHLFDPAAAGASMLFETEFGALHIRPATPETLLVLCLAGNYRLRAIEQVIGRVLDHQTTSYRM